MFIGFPLPIFFAVLLNEMNFQPLKKTVQTVSYLPHFISWVVCATVSYTHLDVYKRQLHYFNGLFMHKIILK